MSRFAKSIDVRCPPDKAFAYLSDITKHGEWGAHGLTVEKTSEGPIAVGSTFSSVGHQMGTHKGVVTLTELVPNEKIVYESNDDTGRMRHEFDFAPANGGRSRPA
jgi:uncharacterized protein YndB with AHSA1/START domain